MKHICVKTKSFSKVAFYVGKSHSKYEYDIKLIRIWESEMSEEKVKSELNLL